MFLEEQNVKKFFKKITKSSWKVEFKGKLPFVPKNNEIY